MTTPSLLAPHTGRRCKPSLPRRVLARLRARRTARAIEHARDEAYLARIEHHEPSPLTAVQVEVDALTAVLAAATGPLPAAMQPAADDPRYPHLDRPWTDDTGTLTKIIEGKSSGVA